jgi:hypothetical protein
VPVLGVAAVGIKSIVDDPGPADERFVDETDRPMTPLSATGEALFAVAELEARTTGRGRSYR